MALLVEHFDVSLPCAPPLKSTDRHNIAKLALGEKCPDLKFFLSVAELENIGSGSVESIIIASHLIYI